MLLENKRSIDILRNILTTEVPKFLEERHIEGISLAIIQDQKIIPDNTYQQLFHAQQRSNALDASEHLHAIYFDGGHFFADEPKSKAYAWLDHHLVN